MATHKTITCDRCGEEMSEYLAGRKGVGLLEDLCPKCRESFERWRSQSVAPEPVNTLGLNTIEAARAARYGPKRP